MKLSVQILFCFLFSSMIYAQTPVFNWATHIGNSGSVYASAMLLDNSGNIYQLGEFNGGPTDFNPGLDSFHLSSSGSTDIFISKLDATGSFLWAKSFGGIDYDRGSAIAVDDFGNIYFTGSYNDVVDFDPGSGVYNLTALPGGTDIYVCKLDSNGNFIWAKSLGGTSSDEGKGIAVDASGVYVTGDFVGTADFDPGSGTSNLTSNGSDDVFLCKLNPAGAFLWAENFGSTNFDYGRALSLDNASNVILTGSFFGTVDFDPGAGVYNLTSPATSYNGFILKLSPSGGFVWATQHSLPSGVSGFALTHDNAGNIFVGGGGGGIGISKLNSSGTFLWSHMLGASNCYATSIDVDASGNVYAAGYFRQSVDFDPSANTAILTSAGGDDAFITKFDASGNYVWAYRFGDSFHDNGAAVAIDANSNIYSFGHFRNTTNFDPGTGTHNLTSFFVYDAFLFKWGPAPVGIADFNQDKKIFLYPNPTHDWVNIDLHELNDVSIKVYSPIGQIIHHREHLFDIAYKFEIDGARGLYIVEVISQDKSWFFKLLKY